MIYDVVYCHAYVDTADRAKGYVRGTLSDDTLDEAFTRQFSKAWKGSEEVERWLSEAESSGRSIPSLYMPKTDKVYFLHGSTYLRCTLATHTADEGFPKSIGSYWPGLKAAGFDSGVDATLWWDEKTVYLFKGDQYVRYNLETDKVDDGYPKTIGSYWSGFKEAGFATGIDAFIRWDDEWAYAFKGDQYIRFHVPTDKVDQSPRKTTASWNALAQAGTRRVLTMWLAPAVPAPTKTTGGAPDTGCQGRQVSDSTAYRTAVARHAAATAHHAADAARQAVDVGPKTPERGEVDDASSQAKLAAEKVEKRLAVGGDPHMTKLAHLDIADTYRAAADAYRGAAKTFQYSSPQAEYAYGKAAEASDAAAKATTDYKKDDAPAHCAATALHANAFRGAVSDRPVAAGYADAAAGYRTSSKYGVDARLDALESVVPASRFTALADAADALNQNTSPASP